MHRFLKTICRTQQNVLLRACLRLLCQSLVNCVPACQRGLRANVRTCQRAKSLTNSNIYVLT